MTYAFAGLTIVVFTQGIALWCLWRRGRGASSVEVRVAQLADALTLLTDTTQAGLASVAAELERSGRPRTGSSSRTATSRRIAKAVGRGRAVRDVAVDEQLSESEIRLHLGLASECGKALRVRGTERTSWPELSTSR